MANKSAELVLEALERAVAEPVGLPLFGTKNRPGLFSGGASGKRAAAFCKEQGLLHPLRTETKGKSHIELCALSEKGLAHLLAETNPKRVLEAVAKAVDARSEQVGEVIASARQAQETLQSIKHIAAQMVQHVQNAGSARPVHSNGTTNGAPSWVSKALDHLADWRRKRALEDCPLPEVYRFARTAAPALTIGQFHDGIRKLHDQQRVYLHPWTGPLYEIPEPALTLMIGHEIIYYASARDS